GYNNLGQLGIGSYTDSNVPVQVDSLTDITAITAGVAYCIALKNDNTLAAWGDNSYGQFGDGTNDASNVPVGGIEFCTFGTTVNNSVSLSDISLSVFPNPVSTTSYISYTLSSPTTITIDLYDALGNKLQQLVNALDQSGKYSVRLEACTLANGVYVLRM